MLTAELLEKVCISRSGAPSKTRVPPGHTQTEAQIFADYVRVLSSDEANALYAE